MLGTNAKTTFTLIGSGDRSALSACNAHLRSLVSGFASRSLLALSLALVVTACGDDGGSGGNDTSTADTLAADTTVEIPDVQEDTTVADTSDQVDTSDGADPYATDAADVYTDPVAFYVVKLDPNLREVAYMKGARAIHLPDMKIRAETLAGDPLVGQTIGFAFAYTGSRAEPATSVTDAEGLTETLKFVLGGDMRNDSARLFLTPYVIGTEPNGLSERAIEAIGVDVQLVGPVDGNGDPLPIVGDGTTVYSFELRLTRGDALRMAADLEVEIELLLDGGVSPFAFEGSSEVSQRWAIDRDTPTVAVNLVSSQAGAATAWYRIAMYQLGANRGDATRTIELVAP